MSINIMIVDDSIFIRAILKQLIENDPEKRFKVVASAKDGEDALIKLSTQHEEIDVITMDVEMPKMNGLEAVKKIMDTRPKPIIMLSSLTKKGAKETVEALSYGAVDFLQKPEKQIEFSKLKENLYEKIVNASKTNKVNISRKLKKPKPEKFDVDIDTNKALNNIVVLGCSTGGPRALQKVVSQLPHNLPVGIVIVQHMPEGGYTASLANHLNQISPFEVKEAKDGMELKDGLVCIAPGGYHAELFKRGNKYQVVLNKRETVSGHRPSVDVLFSSAARLNTKLPMYGIVLTGMGSDGTNGAVEMKKEKPNVVLLAESEETAVIYGMPKQVIKKGIVDHEENLGDIIPKLVNLIKNKKRL